MGIRQEKKSVYITSSGQEFTDLEKARQSELSVACYRHGLSERQTTEIVRLAFEGSNLSRASREPLADLAFALLDALYGIDRDGLDGFLQDAGADGLKMRPVRPVVGAFAELPAQEDTGPAQDDTGPARAEGEDDFG